jgi:HAD superfamily hydrolase (TIGR01549 family)
MTQAKAWLVDLDGTLYSPRPLKVLMGMELLLMGAWHLPKIRAFRKEHELLREEQIDCQGDPFGMQVSRAARALHCEPVELDRLVRHWMVHRPCRWLGFFRKRALLAEISVHRANGGLCALVSDYPARQKLAALGAEDLFQVVVANGEPGGPTQLKPNPAGYLEAAKRLGVNPADCLVIGDREDADGAAARKAGMDFRLV